MILSYEVESTHSGRGFDSRHLHQKEIKMINNNVGGSNDAIPPEQNKNIT